MPPTPDSFRALARSSPWRWTSLHLRHRSGSGRDTDLDVEARLTRPDGVLVRDRDRALPNSLAEQRADGRPTRPWRPPDPAYRSDGLVAERPDAGSLDDLYLGDGLFWGSYQWVAMLDPLELSHHVRVEDPRTDEVAGRTAWRARLVAEPGYEPLCGGNCCELLYSEAGLRADFPDPASVPDAWRGREYPAAYDVALDLATGVVVRIHPIDGGDRAPWLENDILASL